VAFEDCGLSAQQRREALQALAGMSGDERNPATKDSAQGPAKESGQRRGRGKDALGTTSHKRVEARFACLYSGADAKPRPWPRPWRMGPAQFGSAMSEARDERSCKPATPSARKRRTHLATVFGVTLNWRAAAAWLNPPSTTARTIASRPFAVRGAFLWPSIRFSANRWRFGDFRVPGPGRMDNLPKDHS
jgi:hypothetical protein